MQVKVYERGQEVGRCRVNDEGLYWYLECECDQKSDELMGLFGAGHYLGLPERIGNRYYLRRRIAKKAVPHFTQKAEAIQLLPRTQKNVTVFGKSLTGYIEWEESKSYLRIPCSDAQPHPCMSLFCFFEYENGFWLLRMDRDDSDRSPCLDNA